MKSCSAQLLRYLAGARAIKTRSAAALLDDYLQKDAYSKHASKLPVSQRYYYENQRGRHETATLHRSPSAPGDAFREGAGDSATPKPTVIQLRLGAAQILTSSRHECITNHGESYPLYFAQTNPRVAGLCVALVTMLRRLGIRRLTELQGALVPLFLKGTHLIAHAETGTGKSFGIALAIANRIMRDNINYRLHTVIIVPTEELALQYDKWLRHFAGCSSQIVQVAISSIPLEVQLARLHNIAPHVLVGTPQRLADVTRLSPQVLGEKLRRKVDCVVIDEADVVLATHLMYGRQRVEGSYVVDRIFRSNREEVPAQLVAVSATVDGNTARILNTWTRNDRAVRLTTSFVEHSIPSTIAFYFFAAAAAYPLLRLLTLTLRVIHRQCARPRVLLFTAEEDVEELVRQLESDVLPHLKEAQAFVKASAKHWFAASLQRSVRRSSESRDDRSSSSSSGDGFVHNSDSDGFEKEVSSSSMNSTVAHESSSAVGPSSSVRASQLARSGSNIYIRDNSALCKFNAGELLIGVGSHSMARGLHVHDITHVIVYGDFPSTASFIHCAGRTGRMGAEGDVIVLFPPSSGRAVQQMCYAVDVNFVAGRPAQLEALLDENICRDHSLREGVCESETETCRESAVDACTQSNGV